MRKKLAIIVPTLSGGGAQRVMINIVKSIDKKIFDVTLILVKKEGPYISEIPNDINVIDLNTSRLRYSLLKLIQEINILKPEVILSTLGFLNLTILGIRFLLKGNPKIVVREANTPSKTLDQLSRIKKIVSLTFYKHLYPKADLIIAQCSDMKNDIITTLKIQDNKIQYIYNPIDLKQIIKKRTKVNPYNMNKINIISVGRLTEQKGFDLLIDAINIVKEKIPNIHLTILGDGNLKGNLQRQIQNLSLQDSVSIINFKQNPYPYYYYSDTYVLSSRWEGFPNTLLEALACDVNVVATDCKSGPREILRDNEFGVLVKEESSIALATGIMESLNKQKHINDRVADFDVQRIVKQYEQTLLSV